MQGIMMGLFPIQMIHDKPAIFIQGEHGAFVTNGIGQSLIAIMFTLPDLFILSKNFSLCPVCPGETADHLHLILMVDHDGVVHRRMSQTISPATLFAAIEICSGIAGDVFAVEP